MKLFLKSKLIWSLGIPLTVLIIALAIYEFANYEYPLKRRDIGFGIGIIYLAELYSIIVFIICLLIAFVKNKWTPIIIGIILLIFMDLIVIQGISAYPRRIPFIIGLTNGLVILLFLLSLVKNREVKTVYNKK